MWCCNCVHEVVDYGSAAIYKDLPNPEQIRAGVVPLDSLPANWWNALWADTNTAVIEARAAIGSFIEEFATVLNAANVQAVCTCVNNLYCAIEKIRTTIGNSAIAGAVKSSTAPGEVSIDSTTGIMTANCVGNASNLTTSARTLVGAVNELKQVYDCCITELNACTCSLVSNKAPINHLSDTTCYGVGNAGCYGHVKLSDTYDACVGAAADGVAASQAAVYNMFSYLSSHGGAVLGNTVACPLGVAYAGCCDTAARSDHVHPEVPVRVMCTYSDFTSLCWDGLCPGTTYKFMACCAYCAAWSCRWDSTGTSNQSFTITDAMLEALASCPLSAPLTVTSGVSEAIAIPIFNGYASSQTVQGYGWQSMSCIRVYNCTSRPMLLQGYITTSTSCPASFVCCNGILPPGCNNYFQVSMCNQSQWGSAMYSCTYVCAYLLYVPSVSGTPGSEFNEMNWNNLKNKYPSITTGVNNTIIGNAACCRCDMQQLHNIGSTITYKRNVVIDVSSIPSIS